LIPRRAQRHGRGFAAAALSRVADARAYSRWTDIPSHSRLAFENVSDLMYLRSRGRFGLPFNVKSLLRDSWSAPAVKARGTCLAAVAAAVLSLATIQAVAGPVGQRAPEFVLPAENGANVRLSEHRGDVVLLLFWGSGCSTCASALDRLDALNLTYRTAGLVTLGVSVDDRMDKAAEFARHHPVGFPLLLDAKKMTGRSYEIDRLPTAVLIDRSGTVRHVYKDLMADPNAVVRDVRVLLDDAVVMQSGTEH
jgi:peroxiredoxin